MFEIKDDVWKNYLSEALDYLKEYIKIDTSNPPGDYNQAIEFWQKIYEKENVPYKIYISEKGKKSIAGFFHVADKINKKSIILLNHMDVVPANAKDWEFNPFLGEIKDKRILGRGTLDMKGLGIIQLMSAIIIKRLNIPLEYNITVLSVSDEETRGFEGAKFITDSFLDDLNPVFVLDEGTFGIRLKNKPLFLVSYSQKKTLWLKIKIEGCEGHGACPRKDNPNIILLKVLKAIDNHSIYYSNASKSAYLNSLKNRNKMLYNLIAKSNITRLLLLMKKNMRLDKILYFNTLTVTSVISESSPNVIPHTAEVIVDCRLLPDQNVDQFIKCIHRWIGDPRVTISTLKRTDTVASSNIHHEVIDIINEVVHEEIPGSRVKSIVSPVGTDAKYFRNHKVDAFGFIPMLLSLDELRMMHGKNERISVDNFNLAMKIIFKVLINFKYKNKRR